MSWTCRSPRGLLRRRARRLPLLTALLLAVGVSFAQPVTAAAHPATRAGAATTTASNANGSWITWDGSKLTYGQDAQGNRIPDYSYAGYEGGGVPLPTVPTRVTVPPPSGGDDTAAVQNAINQASALPLDANGFRGAVQLSAGKYQIAGTLSINASGVVLRGVDANSSDSELVATGATARTLIQVGSTSASYTTVGTPENVTDSYVPVGGRVLTLAGTGGFAVGDQVVVQRPTTQAWIDALGMTSYWTANWSLYSERTITAVNGNQITLDAPLTTALESQYTQATVAHYTYPRINHVGLENFSADGQAMTADPSYATDFYNSSLSEVNAVQDSWVSNIFTHHFGQNGVTGLNSQSRRVSVVHTGALDMVVNTTTSARSDGYTLQGQENLIQDCQLSGTKLHAFETEARQSGPNVYSNCTATSTDVTFDSGGHQRWGSGTLYDDVTITGGSLNMLNYGSEGTGHGWGDGNSTAWNCNVGSYTVMDPPTAHNWAIGCTGTEGTGSTGEFQNAGANVLPQSLYNEQLAERLGSGASDFSMSAAPASGSVTAGQSTTATVGTAVTSGSAQSVALTASGLPTGATATFSPTSVTAGGSATLTIATGSGTPAGSYPITVTGTAASGTHTASYTLTVTAAGGGGCTAGQLLADPGFESGTTSPPWTTSSTLGFDPITQATTAEPAHGGSWIAWLDGNGTADTDTVAQTVTIPAGCTNDTLSYWQHIDTTETTTSAAPDTLKVQLLNQSGTVLSTLATYSNLNHNTGYAQKSFDVSAYAGQTVTLKFTGNETDTSGGTTDFVIDDTALNTASGAAPTATPYVSSTSGRCLGDANSSAASGTDEVIWDCVHSNDQEWTYNPATKTVQANGMCLDVAGAQTAAGTLVDLSTCNGRPNQQWSLNADGTVTGVPSGLCLDVVGNKTPNGTGVDIWTCNGQTNQQWTTT